MDLGSLASDSDLGVEDFRTSIGEVGRDKAAQRLPPVLAMPATRLPNCEIRLSGMREDPQDWEREGKALNNAQLLAAVRARDPFQTAQCLHSADPNTQDSETGQTPLHLAAESGCFDLCVILLDQKDRIEVNVKDFAGKTALHVAAEKGEVQIAELLVGCGADVNVSDKEGNTPLHLAAKSDHDQLVSVLMRKKPDLMLKNNQHHTAKETSGPRCFLLLRTSETRHKRPIPPSPHFTHVPIHDSSPSPLGEHKPSPADFDLLAQLGKGSFGEVFLVQRKTDGEVFAMKVLRKDKIMNQNLVKYAMTERNVLSVMRHPFIVSLRAAFQSAELLYLLLDYCPGGDMGWHLSHEKRFNEHRARIYAAEVLLALEELHKRDIIFRDLKPDNVVFDDCGHALLTDFGLSKEGIQSNDSARSFCGSLAYLAPEVLRREGHGKAVDWYLLGVLLYEMLVGTPPYFSRSREQLFHNIQYGDLTLPMGLSGTAKSLITAVRTS
jgi:protein-serine/threonine kinase